MTNYPAQPQVLAAKIQAATQIVTHLGALWPNVPPDLKLLREASIKFLLAQLS